ncbi:MAG: alpha/beta hydrolase [Actinomycetes bacterium]
MAHRKRMSALLVLALCAVLSPAQAQAAAPARSGQLLAARNQVNQWIECAGPTTGARPTPTPSNSSTSTANVTPSPVPDVVPSAAPTVVLIPGLGASHTYWSSVRAQLLPTTRVCWYDRPGLGYSAWRTGTRTVNAGTHAKELDALLTAAGETGPFVIVGHSYGGLLARAYGQTFASRTAGMVLVDSSNATQWQGFGKYWGEAGTLINMKKTQQVVYGLPQLGRKPLIVIGAGMGNSSLWQANQASMAKLSKNSVHVTARFQYHVIMAYNPLIVTEGISEVVQAATAPTKTLTPCAANVATIWAPRSGICGPRIFKVKKKKK